MLTGPEPPGSPSVTSLPRRSLSSPRGSAGHRFAPLVPPAGLEPATFWSATRRSIQLSHGGTKAGRQGFEPWVEVSPHSRLAGGPNRPLWHLPVRRYSVFCGGRGIRTPGDLTATAVFKTAAFVHSAIPPGLRGDGSPNAPSFYHVPAGLSICTRSEQGLSTLKVTGTSAPFGDNRSASKAPAKGPRCTFGESAGHLQAFQIEE